MIADLSYDEVRAIITALPGYWRREADHSDNIFTISRNGAREVKTIWIDDAKVVHEIDRAALKQGRVKAVDGGYLDA